MEKDSRRFIFDPAQLQRYRVCTAFANLRQKPSHDAPLLSQIIFGNIFCVYETKNGWAKGQIEKDGYAGYVESRLLKPATKAATHQLITRQSLIYTTPNATADQKFAIGMNAQMHITDIKNGFAKIAEGGFVPLAHIRALDEKQTNFVQAAEKLIGVPYLWGGRDTSGMDCSGLIQAALEQSGQNAPRDSDQQAAELGKPLKPHTLKRGDLIFWKAHTGIMTTPTRLLHANAFHMCAAEEPLAEAIKRIRPIVGAPTAFRRLENTQASKSKAAAKRARV